MSIARIVERSGVSRRTFYEQFSDREDCLLSAFERALTIACEEILPAYRAQEGWRDRVRAGLIALLSFCDREPSIARLLICESQASGPRVAKRRAEILAGLAQIVDQGCTLTGTAKAHTPGRVGESAKAQRVSPLVAEGIVGGVLAVIQTRLAEEQSEPLIVLSSELMGMIVSPYLGAAGARRELERRVPGSVSVREDGVLLADSFKDVGMRLTYRTVRVLVAVAEQPDGSNRQIGESAGITDQGQISKLLGRLQRIGLATNTGIHPGKGAPNSWALTERGERIAQSIRTHTEGSQSHGAGE